MRLIFKTFLINITMAVLAQSLALFTYAQASNLETCPQILKDALSIREALLRPVTETYFAVGGEIFTARAIIGASSAKVYLAFNQRGSKVSLKDYTLQRDHIKDQATYDQMLDYEIEVTRFFREMGEDVPKIQAVSADRHLLVKDYEFGLTFDEIEAHQKRLGLTQNQVKELGEELLTELGRMTTLLNRSFTPWLERNHIALGPMYGKSHGFIEARNMIYSFTKKKWVLFDP